MAKHAEKAQVQEDPAKGPQAPTTPAAAEAPSPGLPAVYEYDEGVSGFENVTKDHMITPLLDVLQAGSPEIVGNTIPGAKAGDLICRALGEVYDGIKGITIVPVGESYCYNEWKPRDAGGGLVAVHAIDSDVITKLRAVTKFGKMKTAEGNEVVETFYLLCLILTEDGTRRVGIPFASTKIPKYKALVTKATSIVVTVPGGRRVTPPFYSHRYKLKTIFTKKNNYSWHNIAPIEFDGIDAVSARIDPRGPIYDEAKNFAIQQKEGQVKIDANQAKPDEGDSDGGGSGRAADAGGDDSPPF